MANKKKVVSINYTALIVVIASSIGIISLLLLLIVALLVSSKKADNNSLAFLEGTYRYDHNDECKPGYICREGGGSDYYIKLKSNGQCYSNIETMSGRIIGSCSWSKSERNEDYICISYAADISGSARVDANNNSICIEYGDGYLDYLSMILYKE